MLVAIGAMRALCPALMELVPLIEERACQLMPRAGPPEQLARYTCAFCVFGGSDTVFNLIAQAHTTRPVLCVFEVRGTSLHLQTLFQNR